MNRKTSTSFYWGEKISRARDLNYANDINVILLLFWDDVVFDVLRLKQVFTPPKSLYYTILKLPPKSQPWSSAIVTEAALREYIRHNHLSSKCFLIATGKLITEKKL